MIDHVWSIIAMIILIVVPLSLFGGFVVSMYRYLNGKRKNRIAPGSVSADEMKKRKIMVIISVACIVVLAVTAVGLVALFALAIAYM